MTVLNFDVRQWVEYHEGLGPAIVVAAQRGLKSAAMRTLVAVQQRTRTAIPASPGGLVGAVDTGDFLRGWRRETMPDGTEVVYNDRTHAPYVEGGRMPGRRMPPVEVIRQWLVRRAGMDPTEAKRAAFPVARAIARRGLNARQIATASDFLDQVSDWMMEEIQREVGDALGSPGGSR